MPIGFPRFFEDFERKVTKNVTQKQTKNVLRPLDLVIDQLLHRAASKSRISEQNEERWLALTKLIP